MRRDKVRLYLITILLLACTPTPRPTTFCGGVCWDEGKRMNISLRAYEWHRCLCYGDTEFRVYPRENEG